MTDLTRYMDPFFGNGTIDLPEPEGIAATWFFIKAQTGNTHPGAQAPLSMISVGAYTGAYPTGYGVNAPNTHATPARYLDAPAAMGFSHLHQSGTGAIQTYYNYFLVTPVALHRSSEGLGWLGTHWRLEDERARPGTYAARLAGTGIKAELTATPAVALHRYTFTAGQTAQLAVDFANGGIDFSRRRTRPSAGEVALVAPNAASGWVVMAGVRLYVYMECTPTRTWDPDGALWVDTERIRGLSRLTLDRDRAKSGASFGVVFSGPAPATVELRLGFSLHSVERARARVEETRGRGFDQVARETEAAWNAYANHVQVEGGTETQKQILYSSLYHSLVKPALWPGEGPWWAASSEEEARPFYLDFATMWDQYKTQLPLLLSLYPERGAEIVNSLLALAEHVGHFPTGFVLDAEMGRFDGQARCLALMTLADAYHRRLPGIDWQRALNAMLADLGQARHADYYQKSLVTPITHTLDLAQACCCTAQIAGDLGLDRVRDSLMAHAARWRGAYDRATGRLIEGRYYEGGLWNYSFRLLHDMAGRIGLYPSEDAYVADLDRFFGYGAPPVVQPTVPGDR